MTRAIPTLILATALALAPAMAGAASSTPSRPVAAENASAPRAKKPASKADLQRYSQREKQAKGLENFEGGRIAEMTIIAVLLLVIIIIIII